jgi:hypothetical protein
MKDTIIPQFLRVPSDDSPLPSDDNPRTIRRQPVTLRRQPTYHQTTAHVPSDDNPCTIRRQPAYRQTTTRVPSDDNLRTIRRQPAYHQTTRLPSDDNPPTIRRQPAYHQTTTRVPTFEQYCLRVHEGESGAVPLFNRHAPKVYVIIVNILYAFSVSELNWLLYFRAESRRRPVNRGLSGTEKFSNVTRHRGKESHSIWCYDTERQIMNLIRERIWVNCFLRIMSHTPLQLTDQRTICKESNWTKTL